MGYRNEGVFSDNALAQAGLNCFDEHGDRTLRFDEFQARHSLPLMDDCYALNLASEKEVWVYWYSSFSLMRLIALELKDFVPTMPVVGAHAIAAREGLVVCAVSCEEGERISLVSIPALSTEVVVPVDERGERVRFRPGVGSRFQALSSERGCDLRIGRSGRLTTPGRRHRLQTVQSEPRRIFRRRGSRCRTVTPPEAMQEAWSTPQNGQPAAPDRPR
ncbi:MAG: hypothetical protein KGJ86_05810 [Chloroflexota bacterium]|nr:hypothetical protein [Chloroflexota bacterium]